MSAFVSGIDLSRRFFAEVVQPLLEKGFPRLPYAGALLGPGSDVLGFDTELSADHGWGPRVDVFLADDSPSDLQQAVAAHLGKHIAPWFAEFPVRVQLPADDHDWSTSWFHSKVLTPSAFAKAYLAIDGPKALTSVDWLTLPSQKLQTIAAGPVFHDGIGLEAWRSRFAWYPHDVWLYVLAAGWARIGQEEHLMGRAGQAGDELGSAIIGARLVRDVMRLCFLMERRFAPYAKWFGSAFQQLGCAPTLALPLRAALAATRWQDRERSLVIAYEHIATMHNALGITPPISALVQPFYGRPFASIATRGFAGAIAVCIQDPDVRPLLDRPWIGAIDQFSDSTDLLEANTLRRAIRSLYV
jgi:hypothetical protein